MQGNDYDATHHLVCSFIMRILSTLTALIAIATFVVAAPHSGVRDVMDDITAAGQVIATLREHTNHISDPGFSILVSPSSSAPERS